VPGNVPFRTRRPRKSESVRILVTFALDNEFAPWRALHEFRDGEWAGMKVHVAQIGGAEVGVILTGAGPKHAGRAASSVMRGEGDSIGLCISSGLAGALRTAYSIGQVLAANSVVSENPRADSNSGAIPASGALISFAVECGATAVGRFYTAERVVARAEEKRLLGGTADAVEMESFEIMSAAAESGVPAVAIRGISDSVDDDMPIDMTDVFTDEGQISMPRILAQAAKNPQSISGLMRLGRNSKAAAEAVARFLDRYVSMVAARMSDLEKQAAAAGNSSSAS
jgi:nucleoside phosphorylase